MAMPADVRHVIGKTAWVESLRTTDRAIADEMRAKRAAKCYAEIREARAGIVRNEVKIAIAAMDGALSQMASNCGSKDEAYATCLSVLATSVVDSWSRPEEPQLQTYGDKLVREPSPAFDPIKAFASDTARSEFSARRDLIEGTGRADGLIHRELAGWLLQNEMFDPVWSALSYLSSVDSRFRLNRLEHFDSLAKTFLERLCNHTFSNWSANASLAFPGADNATKSPITIPSNGPKNATPIRDDSPIIASSIWRKMLSEALHYWKEQRRPGRSGITEATRSVERYINLFGDPCIAHIIAASLTSFSKAKTLKIPNRKRGRPAHRHAAERRPSAQD